MFHMKPFAALMICSFGLAAALPQTVAARPLAGPLSGYNGNWSGGGTITMTDGSQEKIRCRAQYATSQDGADLQLGVVCASDSYKLDVAGRIAAAPGGGVTGTWSEATRQVSGDVVGRVPGPGQLSLNLTGSLLTIQVSASTSGSRQSVALRIPGTSVSSVQISFRRS